LAILSGTTSTTKENRTVVVQMFGSEKNTTTAMPKTVIKTTVTTKVIRTTTSTTTTTTTTKPVVEIAVKVINSTIDTTPIIEKENNKTLLKNISSTIYTQSDSVNRPIALGINVLKNATNNKTTKVINNGFGLGLLFLGIFGIININTQESITRTFKKNLMLKNALVLFIGLGFLLNNFSSFITKIKIPTL
jgi:hypothetical protein